MRHVTMNFALYFMFCVICLASVFLSIRIKRHVRLAHSSLSKRFGFWGNGTYAPASKEKEEVMSDLSFWSYFAAHGSELNDQRLDRMLRARRILHTSAF